ncbi:hypothetical protein [Mucilaginibacter polytrichastri]|nr:hypothetical protein [Mucilaginibacter polytrichastri]
MFWMIKSKKNSTSQRGGRAAGFGASNRDAPKMAISLPLTNAITRLSAATPAAIKIIAMLQIITLVISLILFHQQSVGKTAETLKLNTADTALSNTFAGFCLCLENEE